MVSLDYRRGSRSAGSLSAWSRDSSIYMEKMILTLLFLIALGIILYVQYRNGSIHMQSKTAVKYIGSVGDRHAAFTACSGYTKRVVRFEENRTVRFTFQPELSSGNVIAELLDEKKQIMVRLSTANPTADIPVEAKKRYLLVIRFQSATGSYQLDWE